MKSCSYSLLILILISNMNILVKVSFIICYINLSFIKLKKISWMYSKIPEFSEGFLVGILKFNLTWRALTRCALSSTSARVLPSWSPPGRTMTTFTSPNITTTTSTPSWASQRCLGWTYLGSRAFNVRSSTAVWARATRSWSGSRTGWCSPGRPSRASPGILSSTGISISKTTWFSFC